MVSSDALPWELVLPAWRVRPFSWEGQGYLLQFAVPIDSLSASQLALGPINRDILDMRNGLRNHRRG